MVCGYFLIFDNLEYKRTETNSSIGSIKPIGPDIRLRGVKESVWNSIGRDMGVFRNDSIFTGANSRARVQLKNSETFTIEPNSLVVLSDEKGKQTIEFSNGGLLAEVKKGMRFFVKYKNKEAEITAREHATIRLAASSSGALNLTVLRGEALVQKMDSPIQEVQANQLLDVSAPESKPEVINIALLSPKAGEEKWLKDSDIKFEWQTSLTNQKILEISTDPEFKTLTHSGSTEQNSLHIKAMKIGVYFWRVLDAENPVTKSPVSSFSIRELIPPTVAEYGNMTVNLNKEGVSKNPIQFTWNDSMGSDHYEFELSLSHDFSKLEKQEKVFTTSNEIQRMKPGKYYWRVRSFADNRESLLSNTGELLLNTPIAVPNLAKEVKKPESKLKPEVIAKPIVKQPAKPIATRTIASSTKPRQFGFGLRIGAGANHLQYKQSGTNLTNGSFSNLSAPALSAAVKILFNKKSSVELQYSKWSGSVQSNSTQLSKSQYDLQSINAEYQYRLSDKTLIYPAILLGYRNEQTPFFAVNAQGQSHITTNDLQAAYIGAEYSSLSRSKVKYEAALRYYFPVASKNLESESLKIHSGLWMDGSLGMTKQFNNGFRLGLHWILQYQDLNYNFTYDNISTSGTQNMINNTLQLRIGYDFMNILILPLFYRRRKSRKSK